MLSLLLRARDEHGEPMSDRELRDELMTMLLAGHETTATGLAFAFDLLPRHPEVLDAPARRAPTAVTTPTSTRSSPRRCALRPVVDAAERTLTKPRTIGG